MFGENAIALTRPFNNGLFKDLAFFLYAQNSSNAGYFFILPLMALSIAGLFKIRMHILTDFVIWWIVVNIHNKIYPTLTGGEFLLNQLLFFNCFISDKFVSKGNFISQLKICAHNFGVMAVVIQVCLVYFFAALAKLGDESWLSGTAVLKAAQTEQYSLHSIVMSAEKFSWLFILLNYIVFAYQLLFPVLVWIKRIKKPFLVIGILIHLYIAFVIGLVSFGFVMILSYIYFWPLLNHKGHKGFSPL
jgi:hypothetical protein